MQVPRVKYIWEALVWDWHCSNVRIKLWVQTVFPSPPAHIYSHRTKPIRAFLLRFWCSVTKKSQHFINPSTKLEALQIAFQPSINVACSTGEVLCQLWIGLKLFQCSSSAQHKRFVICSYSEAPATEISLSGNAAHNAVTVRPGVSTNIIVLIASVD